jgi:transcriptional regulator with XRE-family HTH domain
MSKYYTPTKEEIRALRALMGYTQVEMADLLMSSVNAYSRWEQGATKMTPAIWQAVQIIVANEVNKRRKK